MVQIEDLLAQSETFPHSLYRESFFESMSGDDEKKNAPICSSLQEGCNYFHGTKKQIQSNSCKLARLTMGENTTCVID